MMPFTVSALCRNFRRRFLFAKTLSNLRISLAITGCNLEQTIIENNFIIRPLHVTSCTQSKNETKETQVPNTKQNGETDAVKLSEKILKSKELRNIIVKTETDDNKLVTKVTIEKPKESSSSLDKSATTEQAIAPPVKKRLLIDFSASYTERNFITPMRAMTEYLLKQSDLESLPKVLRRSPYESEPPITVYYRKDVDAKAIEVWGSKENLEKELLRREIDRRRYEQDVFTVKRRLRNYRREMGHKRLKHGVEEMGLKTVSGRVVLTAIGINGCNFLFKLCAWLYTGSHSMFSECIHSLADTVNQLILAYGIHKSVQMTVFKFGNTIPVITILELVMKSDQIADPDHPYGYTNMRYVSSLISGVGIFCVGCGLSFYHGVTGILDPQPLHDYYWAYFVLGGAVVSEGATLMVALNAIKKGAKEANMSLYDYSKSIRQEQLDEINSVLERDFMIRAIHDVKGIDIGSNLIRYKNFTQAVVGTT
ncbi:unnamed protein product [Leptidea sinapis]|uniref:Cation efflux protein transmembrane domain-containing protein n=1 Tax=Leptidea sinapis TaxID=189913 RepID=A0A5E4PSQ0_9NEOP|nr:unnamed protein product [Leptidea sinapis]